MKKLKYFLPVLICLFTVSLVFSQDNTTTDTTSNGLNKGVLYLNNNNIDKAIEYFNGLIGQGESNSMLYFYLGDAEQKKGDLKKAIENYKQAIKIDANNVSAYYNLGFVELMEGEQNKAIQDFGTVIKVQPNSILAKMADKQIQSINNVSNTSQILKKWKAEEIALLAEEAKVETTAQKTKSMPGKPGMPPGMSGKPGMLPGMPGAPGMPPGMNGITPSLGVKAQLVKPQKTIEQTIEEIEYGILSVRESASQTLPYYSQVDIQKNLQTLINLVSREQNLEIIKNLLITIGMANTTDAGNFLLKFLNRQNESFSLKLVALESLGNITNNPNLAKKLKDILNSLVNDWENKTEEASSKISDYEGTISSLESDRTSIRADISKLNKTMNGERNKLGFRGGMPRMPMGGPGMFTGQSSANNTSLSADERKTLKEDLHKNQESLKEKQKELRKIYLKEVKLNDEIAKESVIVSFSFATLQSKVPTVSSVSMPQMGQGIPPGMQGMFPGMQGGAQLMPVQTSASISNSFKSQAIQEQEFVFMIIETLGKLGNKDCLDAVQNAWSIFANNSFQIHYYLAEAQLGDYDHIGALSRRLRENYPTGGTQLADEISLRSGIVKALGQYLVQNPNKDFSGLLQYISQSDPIKQVRQTAQQALLKTK